ncbi:Crp/Fnr family transcriptional regulator [Fusibacter sp. 3D3]|uniref:Crp/Fnr family transcriptional regulator n=1 Tax=Fusibacter sp. 3D3 TaxID=1048380 RepID=UPI0008537AC0|nr:Crp/Fnr family transcriptional regulator [Fusibacter sp. 3D3]GAU78633.1 transcriptional regulator [Fusibacter sp. 3D3]
MSKLLKEDRSGELRSFYKQIPMFSHLDDTQLNYLVDNSKEYVYEKGDMICKKNRFAQAIYIVRSGTVSEFAMDWNDFNIIVKTGSKTDCFGDLGVLLGENYFTTVVAETQSKIIRIPDRVFSKVIWENQSAIKEILAMLLIRLQKSAQKSISYTMFNSEGRLAYILAIMHNEKEHAKYIEVTQEALSQKCGIARQTVSTTLSYWKKRGIVELTRGKIAVIDMDALMDIAINCAKTF